MNLLDLYKEMYYKIIENRTRLGTKMVPMITLFVTLTTAETWIVSNLLKLKFDQEYLIIITCALLVVSVLCNGVIAYLFYKTHFRYEYADINMKDMHDFVKNIEKMDEYSDVEKKDYLKTSLQEMFYEAALKNQKENKRKMKNQNKLMFGYLVHFLILVACFYWITLN